jgi:hypothetical protein
MFSVFCFLFSDFRFLTSGFCILILKLMKWLTLLFLPFMSSAQTISGEYFLTGVHETAAGFLLNADSTFQFFYSEGALDRQAKGVWTSDGEKVVFKTAAAPTSDYLLKSKAVKAGNKFVVRIIEPNTILQRYVIVTAFSKGTENTIQTNNEGLAIFPLSKVDSIRMIFQFSPERSTTIKIDGKENWYEFGFEPWLFELFFSNLEYKIDDSELVGKNPFNNQQGRYVRQ